MSFNYSVELPKTEIFAVTLEMVQEHYRTIDESVLTAWRFFCVKNPVEFSGAPWMCFWAGKRCNNALAIKPPIKKAIKEVLAATAELCRQHGLEPDRYVREAVMLLKSLIESVIEEMIRIDRRLRSKGDSKKIRPLPREEARNLFGVAELEEYLEGQALSAAFLAQRSKDEGRKVGGPRPTKKKAAKAKKRSKVKKAEKEFKSWKNSGDARLVIDGQRVKFYDGGGEPKNLRIRNNSQTARLLLYLTRGSMQPKEITDAISPKTQNTAAKIVKQANILLNTKIRLIGFTCLPDYDVEFIKRDEFGSYACTLPIESREQFESWQRDQKWQ